MEATRMRYSRKQAAWQLDISVRSVDYLIARKLLETRKDGKRIFITPGSLARYAATNHYGPFAGGEADTEDQVDVADEVDVTDVADEVDVRDVAA